MPRLGVRKALGKALERASRAARVGNYWYWVDAPELADGIGIASLVCPLRYDVLVRRDFLTFYSRHRDLYASDFNSFLTLVKQEAYYRWYFTSEAVRCKQDLLHDPNALDAGFLEKVRRAASMYDSVLENGFDPKYPIILKTAERLLPPTADKTAPPTGKIVSRRYFLADGCHRLALLMEMGYTVLPPGYFRVKCFREFSPFDSTSLLVRSLNLDAPEYFAFLSSYYCAPATFRSRDDFLGYIRENAPEYLNEVLSVIRVDGFDGDEFNEE